MDRLLAERGVAMDGMRVKNARFAEGIEGLRAAAATREGLDEAAVESDRLAGEAAVTNVPLRDVLSIMDGCEAAHEVMD